MPSSQAAAAGSGSPRSAPMSPGQFQGHRQSTSTNTTRDSTSSSVNGLIQQSFNWLEVDAEGDLLNEDNNSNTRPPSLAPPNPAFRSDRTSNLRVAAHPSPPSSSSNQLPPLAEEEPGSRTDNINNTRSSSASVASSSTVLPSFVPPSRGASMQQQSSTSSNIPYSPLIPTSVNTATSPPPATSEAAQETDHSALPYTDNSPASQQQEQARSFNADSDYSGHRVQSSDQYFYPDGGPYASNSPPPTAPPRLPLPPSPPSIGSSAGSHFQPHPRNASSSSAASASASFRQIQTPPTLYDSPHSPRLPPSPRLNDTFSNNHHAAFQHDRVRSNASSSSNSRSASANGIPVANSGGLIAAAGIPLPSSPYTSYHSLNQQLPQQQYGALPNPSFPARTASISPSERSFSHPQHHPYAASSSSSYYQQGGPDGGDGGGGGQSHYTPPPRNASNSYAQTTEYQNYDNSHVNASFPLAATTSSSPLPSPSYLHPGSNGGGGPGSYYAHPNATESTIWGGDTSTDYDTSADNMDEKKGYYGPLDRGIGMNNLSASPSPGNLSEKRSLKNGAIFKGAGRNGRKKKWWIIAGIAVLVIGAAVVGVVVYLLKRNSNNTVSQNSASDNANGDSGAPSATASGRKTSSTPEPSTTGGDGSVITMENGDKFTYRNRFGGTWSSTPFDDSAKAQSYTPALNERWDYSSDKIYGVNIGGWLHLEPFIAPAMFEPFANTASPAIDEWSLSLALGDNLHDALVEHYETFITEQDFAQIAGAGLNWVRLAIPFWAIEAYPGEPFLEGVCWQYFLKAITWARKYGLRINLDLHTIPGSQNGWNHSGKFGSIGFLNGVMGMANGQRTMNYLRVLTEFINQPEYRNVIPMFGIINEAQANVIGDEVIRAYYLEVYNMMREITGVGEGNGPVISLHDGFSGNLSTWNGYLSGSDRIVMDSHPYLAFDAPNTDSWPVQMGKACGRWGPMFNLSMANVGFTYAGEFSLGINDCGQYLNGVTDGIRYDGTYDGFENVTGSCDQFMDVSLWDDAFRSQVYDFALASMDTFQNWFFWTWKIGNSTVFNRVATPMWSYSLGLQEGYVPDDPRVYHGACVAMAEKYGEPAPESLFFDGSLEPWMTGGAGAGQIAPTQLASYSQWPPVSMANIPIPESLDVALLPTYTATAAPLTLTASPTPTTTGGAVTPVLNGPYFTPIAGCTNYLDPWGAAAATPIGTC